jgi:hypothetical protein
LAYPLGGLEGASVLDLSQNGKSQRRIDLADRNGANARKHVALEAVDHILGVDGGPAWPLRFKPPSRHDLKRGFVIRRCREPTLLHFDYWVSMITQEFAGRIPVVASL